MITCSDCRERLSAYMDQMLDDNETSEVKAHLLGCDVCAESLEKLRTNAQLMCELNVDPPAAFCAQWRADVRAEAQKSKRRWMTMRQMGLVAAALVVALTAWRVWPVLNGSNLNSQAKMESGMQAPEMAADQVPAASLKMAAGAVPDSAPAESAPVPESASAESAPMPAPAADAAPEGMDQAQIMMTEAPAQDSVEQDSATQERNAGTPADPAADRVPSAADSQSPMNLTGAPSENLYAADGADMPLGIISFTFTSVDSAAAHAIVMDALSRMAIKGVVQNGVIAVPPMTEQLSNILLEHVRAVCAERNVSEAIMAATQNNQPPAATQIVVAVK